MQKIEGTGTSYLSGNYAPVTDELTVFDLPVRGTVPAELSGRLLRNGPNPIQVDDPVMYHWFLGDGMVHAIELRDGRAVSYRNRWVRTDRAARLLGEAPPPNQPDDVFIPEGSPANTNVIQHAGRILTLVEVCLPVEITPELETVGRFDYNGKLRSPMTAHPKEDPVTGELVFFGYNPIAPPYLRYHVADAAGNLVRSEDIAIPAPTMIHDFAITERYAVFFDLPVVFDLNLLGSQPFPAGWKPENGARLGLMPRDGTNADVRWFDIDPCYVFHSLNAYEDGDRVVVDVVRYPSMFSTDGYQGPDDRPSLTRWTIDPTGGKVLEERIDEHGQEFPRIDDRRMGRRHRFGYATQVSVDADGFHLGGIVRHDLDRGTTEFRDLGRGRASSEPVFVPAGPAEEDGYLLAVVYDAAEDSSELLILGAADITGEPAAVVSLPRRVPFGFHGDWVPDPE